MENSGKTEYGTNRFKFVTLTGNDLNLVYELYCNEVVMKKIMPKLTKPQAKTLLDDILVQQQNRASEFWRIECASTGESMGIQGFMASDKQRNLKTAEFGILLKPSSFGKKVATESVIAMLLHGFSNLKLESVHAFFNGDNLASGRIVEKLGFSIEPVLNQPEQKRCAISRTDFFTYNKELQCVPK